MIVLYYSLEPSGPAMMEAALIEKYNSTLFAYVTGFFPIRSIQKLMCVDPIPFSSNPIIKHAAPPRYAWLQKRQSRRGHHDPGPIESTLDGQLPPVYMIYVVYRSFKYPPAVKLKSWGGLCTTLKNYSI